MPTPTPWFDPGTWPADCPRIDPALPDPTRPRYELDLDVDLASALVTGSQHVLFTPDLPIDELVLRLWPNGPRPAAAGNALTISDVRVDGVIVEPVEASATLVRLPLAGGRRPGEAIMLDLDFDLRIGAPNRGRMAAGADWARLGSFFPLLPWQPGVGWANDAPTSGFAEVVASPAADFDVTIGGVDELDVLATGQEVSPGRWQGALVRDFAMSIGDFDVATVQAAAPGPVTVTVARHRDMADNPKDYAARIASALEFFAQRWGSYPWPSLSVALTPELRGGIEFPTHVLQGAGSIGRTTPHEVAHQWFYALVGNNQGLHPWLDEGLASYAEFRFEGVGPDDRQIPGGVVGLAGEPMSFWEFRLGDYYQGVYVQTAMALLRADTTDKVDCVLRRYVAANAWQIATPGDFAAAAAGVIDGLDPTG